MKKPRAAKTTARPSRPQPPAYPLVLTLAVVVACFVMGASGQTEGVRVRAGAGAQRQGEGVAPRGTRSTAGRTVAIARPGAASAGGSRAAGAGTLRNAAATGVVPALGPDAPRLVVKGALRLCGGDGVPKTLHSAETLCLEQRLTGVTRRQVRSRQLEATGVNVTFGDVRVNPSFVGSPSLFASPLQPASAQPQLRSQRGSARGFFSNLASMASLAVVAPIADADATTTADSAADDDTADDTADATDAADATAADADADAFVRFNLTVAGLSPGVSGDLEATVTIAPAARASYEIVWYELELTLPTFYSGAVDVIVKEGELQGQTPEEIQEKVDGLVSGNAVFFPCTTFLYGSFCEDKEISV